MQENIRVPETSEDYRVSGYSFTWQEEASADSVLIWIAADVRDLDAVGLGCVGVSVAVRLFFELFFILI